MVNHRVSKCPWPAKRSEATRVLMPILMNPTLTSKTIDTIEWLSKCPRLNAYKYLQMLVAFNRINLSLSLWETLSPCGTVHVRKLYASTCKLYRQNGICISLLALLCLTNASRVTSLSSVGKVLSSFCPFFHHITWHERILFQLHKAANGWILAAFWEARLLPLKLLGG